MKKTVLLSLLILWSVYAVSQTNKQVVFDDTLAMSHIAGGYYQDSVLVIEANSSYDSLPLSLKQRTIECFTTRFYDCQVVVKKTSGSELWLTHDGKVSLIDNWDFNDPHITDFLPLRNRLKRSGRWFYYIGGSFTKADETTIGSLGLRGGSYLLHDKLDLAASLNLGHISPAESSFTGDIGLSSRYYLPYRLREPNIVPYAGGGISWTFAPTSLFELQLIAGIAWLIGSGSLDLGIVYGIESGFSLTLGYTFRPGARTKK